MCTSLFDELHQETSKFGPNEPLLFHSSALYVSSEVGILGAARLWLGRPAFLRMNGTGPGRGPDRQFQRCPFLGLDASSPSASHRELSPILAGARPACGNLRWG